MRGGKTLPIANVPNLQAGDRLWIHPDFPDSQSVHFLVVVAFLRGATNPPPENWFTKAEAWNKGVREEGFFVTCRRARSRRSCFWPPKPAAIMARCARRCAASLACFRAGLAGFKSGQPGPFAAGSIHEASTGKRGPGSQRAARPLRAAGAHPNIRLELQCFDKPLEQQPSCLMQNSDQRVLDDGHSQSMVAALTTGPSTDLIGAMSATPLAGGGSYSPYVGAVVDLAKIMESFRSPDYQYIPALALPQQEQLNLRLNNPPSFRKPKSVIVVGLPAVEAAQLPPLRPVHPGEIYCLQKPSLVLPEQY